MIKPYLMLSLLLAAISHLALAQDMPEHYVCLSARSAIRIDGDLSDPAWEEADWTQDFVDIEGDKQPAPLYRTHVKMLWDQDYFYIAAEIEEPQLWATYDQRDMVIFHENDFEVFIDPDGDTHQYYELEVNALGTYWDLMLVKPYRDGGEAIDSWDIQGLKRGIKLNGTLNDPSDVDLGWTVELAIPWSVLKESAKDGKRPGIGDQWRVNFSRVNWRLDEKDGQYVKRINPETGKPYPEYNWVWSPQGVIAMHQPETWGYVSFVEREDQAKEPANFEVLMLLRRYYDAQRAYLEKHGKFSSEIDQLKLPAKNNISIFTTPSSFEIIVNDPELGRWHINQEGRTWK